MVIEESRDLRERGQAAFGRGRPRREGGKTRVVYMLGREGKRKGADSQVVNLEYVGRSVGHRARDRTAGSRGQYVGQAGHTNESVGRARCQRMQEQLTEKRKTSPMQSKRWPATLLYRHCFSHPSHSPRVVKRDSTPSGLYYVHA
jgi:hypothetical protein